MSASTTTTNTPAQQQHADRPHAICSASGAYRWLACPGSVGMVKQLEQENPELIPPPSEYALEGTRAHELAEKLLGIWMTPGVGNYSWQKVAAWAAANIVPNKRDDRNLTTLDYVLAYVRECEKAVRERFDLNPTARSKDAASGWPTIKIEARLMLDEDLQMYGTADFVATGISNRKEDFGKSIGLIVDLKYGRGIRVGAEGNDQLAYYGSALKRVSKRQLTSVDVRIVQPRIGAWDEDYVPNYKEATPPADVIKYFTYHVATASFTADEANQWYGILRRGAERAIWQSVTGRFELSAGSHCRFCPAKGICRVFARHVAEEAALDFVDLPADDFAPATIIDARALPPASLDEVVSRMSPEQVAKVLDAWEKVVAFGAAVKRIAKAQAFAALAENGKGKGNVSDDRARGIPGYKLVEGRANRQWDPETFDPDSNASVEAFVGHLQLLGVEEPFVYEVKSVAVIEKEVGKKHFKQHFGHLVHKPHGKLTLVKISDKRPALLLGSAADDFGDDLLLLDEEGEGGDLED